MEVRLFLATDMAAIDISSILIGGTPILLSIAALLVSIISALRLYDRSQRSNAKDVFVYPKFHDGAEENKAQSVVSNRSANYPIFDIEVYYLGCTIDPRQPPILWGTAQQILPKSEKEFDWPSGHHTQRPLTSAYVKGIADLFAEKYINYRIVCLFSTSSKKRWLKSYDGEFYRYNSPYNRLRKYSKLLKISDSQTNK